MLYDQAQIAVSYTTAFLITKDKQYSDIVHDILQYVSRDLSHKVIILNISIIYFLIYISKNLLDELMFSYFLNDSNNS